MEHYQLRNVRHSPHLHNKLLFCNNFHCNFRARDQKSKHGGDSRNYVKMSNKKCLVNDLLLTIWCERMLNILQNIFSLAQLIDILVDMPRRLFNEHTHNLVYKSAIITDIHDHINRTVLSMRIVEMTFGSGFSINCAIHIPWDYKYFLIWTFQSKLAINCNNLKINVSL